jgi:HD-GYP domain-containing protein (c-di-GMP phosphodiesterase class II)/ABC-type amino acid transport substrate-binding protein
MTVVTVFVFATALTAALAIGLQYHFGRANARRAAAELNEVASARMAAEFLKAGENTAGTMDLLAHIPAIFKTVDGKEELELLTRVLMSSPIYHAVFLGRDDGGFLEVVNLDASARTRQVLRAHPSDRWVVVTMQAAQIGRERRIRYLDENLVTRLSRTENTNFDPRQTDWYRGALVAEDEVSSGPHLFPGVGIPGETLSRRIRGTEAVVGMRLVLSQVSELLTRNKFHDQAEVFLYRENGEVFASSWRPWQGGAQMPLPAFELTAGEKKLVAGLPRLRVSNELNWPPFDYAQEGRPMGYSIDVMKMLAAMTGLQLDFVNGHSWTELVGMFEDGDIDLLHSVILTGQNRSLGLAGKYYKAIPYGLATRPDAAAVDVLDQLEGATLAIPRGWSIIPVVRARFPKISIVEVDDTRQALEWVQAGKVDAALDNEIIMRFVASHYFLDGLRYHTVFDLGQGDVPDKLHVLVPPDQPGLRRILDRAIAAIGPRQREYLDSKWLAFEAGREMAASSAVPNNTLIDMAADPALQNRIVEIDHEGEDHIAYVVPMAEEGESDPLYIGILTPLASVQGPFLADVRLSIFITAGFLLLVLPLSWFFANPIVHPIRRLAEENDKVRRRRYDLVERVASHVKELDELSGSMVDMVESIQAHELAQRKLMDSFIELIAQAIDDKSPYTGGHCKRVPDLAVMLAEHATRSDRPPFSDFAFENDDQWREYRIAAWLHDCGKITTPEHIVDKGSKLETIYNRIHEVRMRFEVLWRDAQIAYLRKVAEAPLEEARFAVELEETWQELQDDFAFVAECNVGGEFLDPAKLERLHEIAGATWIRYFDDRLGLSPVEEMRAPAGNQGLPATERLLSDKPEAVIGRPALAEYPPEMGIDMDVPAHVSNLGELHNLSVSRGTLTAEDRFRIQEHMISTIKMLESLPFPAELKNVPRYASTHHETMKGTGYPRGLAGDQLSIPEKLLAVADVFEALTASDRPYKKAKTVSEAVDILHRMVCDGHLDEDCFELFLENEVYLQYAEKHLAPEQIDQVDADRYLVLA